MACDSAGVKQDVQLGWWSPNRLKPWSHRPEVTPRFWKVQRSSAGPEALQCHGSPGRFVKPNDAALVDNHAKARDPYEIALPFSVKSTAWPVSCLDRPGTAVGTLHDFAGAVSTSGHPFVLRRAACWAADR